VVNSRPGAGKWGLIGESDRRIPCARLPVRTVGNGQRLQKCHVW
jgi:hypothetical protein